MAHGEAREWWADVQHLRDDYERTAEARRRADQADLEADRGFTTPARRTASAARTTAGAPARQTAAIPTRRTVEIRGRTVPAPPVTSARVAEYDQRRPARSASDRIGARPDRMALWALLMGVVLIFVAVGTADAATVAVVAGR